MTYCFVHQLIHKQWCTIYDVAESTCYSVLCTLYLFFSGKERVALEAKRLMALFAGSFFLHHKLLLHHFTCFLCPTLSLPSPVCGNTDDKNNDH